MPYQPTIVRAVTRPPGDEVRELAQLGTATVHEAYRRRGLLSGISSMVPGSDAGGPAVTCLNYAGDNLMIHAALEVCRPGDVLVVAVTAPSLHGMLGELLATVCVARGLAGVVLDAGVRDIVQVRAMGLPVFARTVSALGTTKAGLGYVNVPVSCGGVVVAPGDVVVGDDDGVVAVERDAVAEVLSAGRRRQAREIDVRERYAAGALTLDTGTMRETLQKGGVVYLDGTGAAVTEDDA
ncbi:MAG: 4-carboxy-4-hydroxy-2-oxoadipate aldolase/oxaloacetate decarboxylase [Actinomycetota bacterium]|nr:4-carboxy-4-hydroxy-2-oxoadipate aldolase/oxaloacetate decarboxylase [Actinomycetota bacterium]